MDPRMAAEMINREGLEVVKSVLKESQICYRIFKSQLGFIE